GGNGPRTSVAPTHDFKNCFEVTTSAKVVGLFSGYVKVAMILVGMERRVAVTAIRD
ncbi:MAG: hypothetical protein Q9192_007671, partial [Flavoplaca navasiana]